MTPHAAATASHVPHHIMSATGNCLANAGIIGALLDALSGDGDYRLVDRGGELFIEGVGEDQDAE